MRGAMGSQKSNKKKAQDREQKLGDRFKGEATPNSGATPGRPGDVSLKEFLVEDKFTGRKSYSVTCELLNKICKEAYSVGKSPAFIVHFEDHIGQFNPDTWVLLPLDVAEEKGFLHG